MDTGIGATLREAREEQGRSIEDMALALRARVTQLRDLEEERFDTFGGDVYAKGFLKSYAIELGLDPAPLLETYRREVAPDEGEPTTLASGGMVQPKKQRRASPPGWVAAVVVAVIVVAVVGFIGALGPGTTPETAGDTDLEIDDPPPGPDADAGEDDAEPGNEDDEANGDGNDGDDNGEAEDADDETSNDDEAETEDDADADEDEAEEFDGVELVLEFEGRSWTRIEVDGAVVLEETVEAGEILPFEADEEIVARFGNAGGVRAQLNGEDLGAQGGQGDVVDVVFTPDGAETA